jgi:hypothetical protein
MREETRIILLSDVIEQKLRKEKELEYYLKELEELQRKIGWLQREVDLTNTIIDMIKSEQVVDLQEQMLERHSDKLLGKDDE